LSDKIISLTALILSSAKNICSVLQSHIPSAPNFLAIKASAGVSAFVLIPNLLYLSAHCINVAKSQLSSGSTVFSSHAKTSPVEPSNVKTSHSLNVFEPIVSVLDFSSITISLAPATQHFHIHLATTAACEVIPHLAVKTH